MTWTDERMDDFAAHTDRRFDEVDRRLDRIERRFEQVDDRIHGLHQMIHRTMLQLGTSLVITVALGFVGIFVTQL